MASGESTTVSNLICTSCWKGRGRGSHHAAAFCAAQRGGHGLYTWVFSSAASWEDLAWSSMRLTSSLGGSYHAGKWCHPLQRGQGSRSEVGDRKWWGCPVVTNHRIRKKGFSSESSWTPPANNELNSSPEPLGRGASSSQDVLNSSTELK